LPQRHAGVRPGQRLRPADYDDSDTTHQFTYNSSGGYHSPGVIDHELNHFLLQDYFGVTNTLDCGAFNETKYFQEGGLGRTLPQMFWHHYYGVGYMPDWNGVDPTFNTDKLFQSTGVSGRPHNPLDATSLNALASFACGTDPADPYSWGGIAAQPMWEIYHGNRVDGTTLVSMPHPAGDTVMIRSMYYAADMASASTFADRFELANRFMEWWDLSAAPCRPREPPGATSGGTTGWTRSSTPNYCS
jgi:hypothetical protein